MREDCLWTEASCKGLKFGMRMSHPGIIERLRNRVLKTSRASATYFVFLTFEDSYKYNCLGAERVQEDGQGARLVGSLRVGWKRNSRESRHLR